jgi:hypothetical protein
MQKCNQQSSGLCSPFNAVFLKYLHYLASGNYYWDLLHVFNTWQHDAYTIWCPFTILWFLLNHWFIWLRWTHNHQRKQHRGLPLVFSLNKYSFTKCHLGFNSNRILSDVRGRVLYDNTWFQVELIFGYQLT